MMSTVAKLLAQREQLLERLEAGPGPNEREEVENLLIQTALAFLDEENDAGSKGQ
jgi:hypothetical protein